MEGIGLNNTCYCTHNDICLGNITLLHIYIQNAKREKKFVILVNNNNKNNDKNICNDNLLIDISNAIRTTQGTAPVLGTIHLGEISAEPRIFKHERPALLEC